MGAWYESFRSGSSGPAAEDELGEVLAVLADGVTNMDFVPSTNLPPSGGPTGVLGSVTELPDGPAPCESGWREPGPAKGGG